MYVVRELLQPQTNVAYIRLSLSELRNNKVLFTYDVLNNHLHNSQLF